MMNTSLTLMGISNSLVWTMMAEVLSGVQAPSAFAKGKETSCLIALNGDNAGGEVERAIEEDAEIGKGDYDKIVGVIHPWLDFYHPDLTDNADEAGSQTFVPGTTDAWDQNGHGTHVEANGKVLGAGSNLMVRAYRVFGAPSGRSSPGLRMLGWLRPMIV
jgi:hypothetical protein